MANGAVDRDPAALIRQLWPADQLLRALTKAAWLQDLHQAFLLRSDETGLSVCFDCAPEDCITVLKLNRVHGVASLTVEEVTTLQLTVTADEPHHAVIEGIPHKDDDPVRAEHLASQLAAIARIIDRTRREAPERP